jgi:hypothetical protein
MWEIILDLLGKTKVFGENFLENTNFEIKKLKTE